MLKTSQTTKAPDTLRGLEDAEGKENEIQDLGYNDEW